MRSLESLHATARHPLAGCIASLFALAAPAAVATNLPVTTCADTYPVATAGSLRAVAAAAADGDVVDMSGLSCTNSKITLATGGIHIAFSHNITLQGPAHSYITIDGSGNYDFGPGTYNKGNVLFHTGTGNLHLNYVHITGGHQRNHYANGLGGGVYSKGTVYLYHAEVSNNTVYSETLAAKGGGIYAQGSVSLFYATIGSNTATSAASGANGGGISANGVVAIVYSGGVGFNHANGVTYAKGGGIESGGKTYSLLGNVLITNNYATATAGPAYGAGIDASIVSLSEGRIKYNTGTATTFSYGGGANAGSMYLYYMSIDHNKLQGTGGLGGGLHASGKVTIGSSTISRNTATQCCGGVDAFSKTPAGKTFLLENSTVSSNYANTQVGGVYANTVTTKFLNSTIAFNNAGTKLQGSAAGGLYAPVTVTMQSTLMSNNGSDSVQNDFSTLFTVSFDPASADNVVRATSLTIPGTSSNVCPLLGPLRNNGGPTLTHALDTKSPLIDSGNNTGSFSYDQRGVGFPRVLGPPAQLNPHPDIGALEYNQADEIFRTNIDNCVPLS